MSEAGGGEAGTLRRPVAFLVAGAWNTAFSYGLYAATYLVARATLPLPDIVCYTGALLFSNAVSLVQGFLVYKHLVFKSKGRFVVEFPKYVATYALLIGVNVVLLPLIVELSGVGALLAQAGFLFGAAAVSYVMHSRFTFGTRAAR